MFLVDVFHHGLIFYYGFIDVFILIIIDRFIDVFLYITALPEFQETEKASLLRIPDGSGPGYLPMGSYPYLLSSDFHLLGSIHNLFFFLPYLLIIYLLFVGNLAHILHRLGGKIIGTPCRRIFFHIIQRAFDQVHRIEIKLSVSRIFIKFR